MALGAWLRVSLAVAIIGLSTLLSGHASALSPRQYRWDELPGDAFNAQGSALKASVYVSVGARVRGKAPLLVLLHGCEQDASSFFTDSGWMDIADRYGLIVLLPEQQHNAFAMVGGASRYGNPLGCFNFADRLTSSLKGGVPREAGAIVSMVDAVRAGKGLDRDGPQIGRAHV